MKAEEKLLHLSAIENTKRSNYETGKLISSINENIKDNLIYQFNIFSLFDNFKEGGGVDTIHNVRNGVYSSDKVKNKLYKKTSGYNKNIAKKFHGGSDKYRTINKRQTIEQYHGKLCDPNTGKYLKRNQKTDLDHTISTKEIYEDKGRALSGQKIDDLANNDDNLHKTDRSINRSMGEQNKTDYANSLDDKKKIWKQQNIKDQNNPNLSQQKKDSKNKNTKNRMSADSNSIKKNDKQARKMYNRKINSYYLSSEFMSATCINSAKQGGRQALSSAIGIIFYQIQDVISNALNMIIKTWHDYKSLKDRFNVFINNIKDNLTNISDRLLLVENSFVQGFIGGFTSAIFNTLLDKFITTTRRFGKILNDSFTNLVSAFKIMFDSQYTLELRMKKAGEIIIAAILSSVGLSIGENLGNVVVANLPVLAFLKDDISKVLGSIIVGTLTGLTIFVIDDFSNIIKKFKKSFKEMMAGNTINKQTIKVNYEKAINQIDSLYHQALTTIFEQYEKTNRLQLLAYDMDLPDADQFQNSIPLARHLSVKEDSILKNKKDIVNFFKN
ncbi:hypothetical protein [Apilactobacillus timberlakei]|uniref:Cation diffusion facilitator family transporter n=1 Tax=Apilactobacillus timberlakei TaxID=2008380 RepID=A0ABY2YSI3_9LACO|nr:hypothetical protein [Apilactobacillus timberlakei]TPR14258.1 hypothetical protein DY048_04745 [Apilactobacillus timberlakei]TPR16511.1 hypothetical protein DY052_02835 [Apilactobacillus timberlakei]